MSKSLLAELFLLQTKALVNAYTWSTLPFYTIVQKPWQKVKLSKSFDVQRTLDSQGRLVYSRPCRLPNPEKQIPYLGMHSFNQMVPLLDRNQKKVGVRKVLQEETQIDPKSGQPVKVDGRTLKKLHLAPDFEWLTVAQILDRVDGIARGLQDMGVSQGSKVILFAENSLEWFCTALALQRLNACTVTLLSILSKSKLYF